MLEDARREKSRDPEEILLQALFLSGPERIEKLKNEVRDAKGTVVMLVHPFFEKYHSADSPDPELDRFLKRTNSFIASTSPAKPPILILEERKNLEASREHSTQVQAPNMDGVYFMPTLPSDPRPSAVLEFSFGERLAGWPEFTRALKLIGVKKVVLGGMYLRARSGLSEDDMRALRGCVNATWSALREFDVQLSSFAYPATGKQALAGIKKERTE